MKFSFFQIYSINRVRVSATFRKFQQLSESFRKFKNAEVTLRKFQNISDFLRKFQQLSDFLRKFQQLSDFLRTFQQLSDFEPLAELPSILRNVICIQTKYNSGVQHTPGLGTAYNAAEKHVLIDILSLKTADNPFVVGCHQNGSCSPF